MKKIFIGMTAFAMIMATSCSNEELIDNQQAVNQKFTLNVSANANSRTLMADNGIVWGEIGEEAVYVFSESKKTYGILYLVEVKNEGKTATFTGRVNGFEDLKYVVYPAPIVNGNNIPAPDDLKINMDKINGENHNAPMYGTITSGNSRLINAGGLVKFEIKGVDSDEAVSFSGTVTIDGVSTPVTGGYYTFESGKLVYNPVQNSQTFITGFPESGIVYLPVAIEGKYQSKDQAPKANIKATLHNEVPGGQVLATVSDIPLSNGDVAYQEVPTFNIVKDADGEITNNGQSQWIGSEDDFSNLSDGSYKLKNNIDLQNAISITNGTIIIDLNGYHIWNNTGDVFDVTGGNLTIQGNGEVYAAKDNLSAGNAVWVRGVDVENTIVTIEGGTYYVGDDNRNNQTSDSRNDCIYLGQKDTDKGGKIYIKAGTFEYKGTVDGTPGNTENTSNDGHKFLINQNNRVASKCIFITGGKFYKFNPAIANTDDNWMKTEGQYTPGSYLAEDGKFTVTEDKDGYFVVK